MLAALSLLPQEQTGFQLFLVKQLIVDLKIDKKIFNGYGSISYLNLQSAL